MTTSEGPFRGAAKGEAEIHGRPGGGYGFQVPTFGSLGMTGKEGGKLSRTRYKVLLNKPGRERYNPPSSLREDMAWRRLNCAV